MEHKEIIRQIVARHQAKKSLTAEASSEECGDLYNQACEQFGAWETALEYSGIAKWRVQELLNVDKRSTLVESILKLSPKERCMQAVEQRRHHRKLYYAAILHFGKWKAAVKYAESIQSVSETS